MSILTTKDLGLSFGAFDLFAGISVSIANDSKIGLIGQNGIGKTSLLLMMAGINQPTRGSVTLARGKRLGYLRQEAVEAFADRSNSVYDEMLTVFTNLQAQLDQLNAIEAQMAGGEYSPELLESYGEMQHQFEIAGGYDFDLRIRQTLEGLNLGQEYWHVPLSHLSGGQKTRVLLARLLLEKPDLLMLDEPTNHLDIEAVEWLEKTLHDWDGAVLIVSHDRYFLDNTVNTIWEMNRSGIEEYKGNYSAYLLQRQERWEYSERVFIEEKARLVKEVDFIQRNWVRASTHARALGLLRRLTRDLAIVERYGVMALRSGKKWSEMDISADRPLDVIDAIRRVNSISIPNSRPPQIRPRLAASQTSGTYVLRSGALSVGYPGHPLFTAKDIELRRGECAALIGPNGSGKTTFLKVLLGQLAPLRGEIQMGGSLKVGYFAQAQDALNPANTVLEELVRHKAMQAEPARSYLAQYLFRGDDVFKPVSALSGGERARLALAIMALEGANFLLLDEPTNHLDIPAREALQEVLQEFAGTILLVSHDRYLIDRLATQIWNLKEGTLSIFAGTYHEFVLRSIDQLNAGKSREMSERQAASRLRQALLPDKPLLRGNGKQTRQRAQTLALLEERIQTQEIAIQRLSIELQKAGSAHASERVQKVSWELAKAQAALDQLMVEWEKVAA